MDDFFAAITAKYKESLRFAEDHGILFAEMIIVQEERGDIVLGKLSVLYLSRTESLPGTGYRAHIHDYWHFSVRLSGRCERDPQNGHVPVAYCHGPGVLNDKNMAVTKISGIQVLFLVHDKILYKRLEKFPFSEIPPENLHIPVLMDFIERVYEMHPGQDYIDYAFGHYLYLLLETNERLFRSSAEHNMTDRVLDYIETHYKDPVKLEDVAAHIGRTPQHTAYLIKKTTDKTVVEHINEVRIRHACIQLAYSDEPIEQIIADCGFGNISYFYRLFKERMGTTPTRYRTSHDERDVFYQGDEAGLDVPYESTVFTYIPAAGKCVRWNTPREYLIQRKDRLTREESLCKLNTLEKREDVNDV